VRSMRPVLPGLQRQADRRSFGGRSREGSAHSRTKVTEALYILIGFVACPIVTLLVVLGLGSYAQVSRRLK